MATTHAARFARTPRIVRIACLLALLLSPGAARGDEVPAPPLPTIAVLDPELIDTSGEATDQRADHARRLDAITRQIREGLGQRRVYRVIDTPELRAAIAETKAHQYLNNCNGCELDLARSAGAERVLTGSIYKVSTLILSMTVDIKNVATGETILHKALSFRGDNDAAWDHAAAFLVRYLASIPPTSR